MAKTAADKQPVVIKKYANRRLYDTGTSAYITLDDLYQRVKDGEDFVVKDAKTDQDLTRQILTQIIFEQEIKGFQLLPTTFLRETIRFCDDKMGGVLQHYLEASMNGFITNQERMQGMVGKVVGGVSPLGPLEEMTRQNVAFFEKAFQMFTPFGGYFSGKAEEEQPKEEERNEAKRKARR
jgi:polyhydroxyalkanoate synthesis repressor PhaR